MSVSLTDIDPLAPVPPLCRQNTQYTVVLHMRYSAMWCLRYGVVCCVLCVVYVLCVSHWAGLFIFGVSCHT